MRCQGQIAPERRTASPLRCSKLQTLQGQSSFRRDGRQMNYAGRWRHVTSWTGSSIAQSFQQRFLRNAVCKSGLGCASVCGRASAFGRLQQSFAEAK